MKVGDLIRDTITGFEGIAIARTDWLNGCVRFLIQPKMLHEGKPVEAQSFDQEQCELVGAGPELVQQPTGGGRPNPVGYPKPTRP